MSETTSGPPDRTDSAMLALAESAARGEQLRSLTNKQLAILLTEEVWAELPLTSLKSDIVDEATNRLCQHDVPPDSEHGDDCTWIQTFLGERFWPLDPRPQDVHIKDIAHALSMTCRFTGHTREFYSVAQHSVAVSRIVPEEYALWGLLHDAGEAYLADLARPVKQHMPAFRAAEDKIMRCIADRFSLSWPEPAAVKAADILLLATEHRDLMARPPRPWRSTERVRPLDSKIIPESADLAGSRFLQRFRELREKS